MKCGTSQYLPASNVTVPANQHSPGLVLASSLHMHQPECIQGFLRIYSTSYVSVLQKWLTTYNHFVVVIVILFSSPCSTLPSLFLSNKITTSSSKANLTQRHQAKFRLHSTCNKFIISIPERDDSFFFSINTWFSFSCK